MGTEALELPGDLAVEMVAGIDRYLTRCLAASQASRARHWDRDLSSHASYVASVEPNRCRLREIVGAVDSRDPGPIHRMVPLAAPAEEVARAAGYRVYEVQWRVMEGHVAEGLLLEPTGPSVGNVIALPDCDVTPEVAVGLAPGIPAEGQFARRLAESGCRVLVPAAVDRRDTHSGVPGVRMTNQPHREFIYRAAYELGRHIVGYEVQAVLAAADALAAESSPVGVYGHGEGGLIAFVAGALDTRLRATGVSGYFGPREALWQEPIYRNLFGLLEVFGDAEIASLVAPRALVVEASQHPSVCGPPDAREGRGGAAPGRLETPPLAQVQAEFRRAVEITRGLEPCAPLTLAVSGEGQGLPGCEEALSAFLGGLGVDRQVAAPGPPPEPVREGVDPQARLERQFGALVGLTQDALREAPFRRARYWSEADPTNLDTWVVSSRPYRETLWQEVIGPLPEASLPLNPRTRLVHETPYYQVYEVVLDVHPDVFAHGFLLVPQDLQAGERRPVVVAQHGLEGHAAHQADPEQHQFATALAQRGFVVYAPQNPYLGGDDFRVLQRKANPLKLSLFSFIVRQHEQTLAWLSGLTFVDADRMAFYGISYGGKTAMRVPALVEGYCLSICCADFNEWIWKNASARDQYSYLLTGEYEMPEFNLGNTFNYAEMSWLICPRPFMVERGHDDGVAPDEWVAYEYARTRRHYVKLGIGERTEIEYFNGPHAINGVGTYDFLHRHLNFPLHRIRWR